MMRRSAQGFDVLHPVARVYALEPGEAPEEKSGAHQEDQGEGDLENHQPAPVPGSATGGGAAGSLLQVLEPHGQYDSRAPGRQGQDDAFHQELAREPLLAGSQSGPDGQLRDAGGASGHEK